MSVKILERDCAKLIICSALMDVSREVEEGRIPLLTEHAITNRVNAKIGEALTGTRIRINELTYKVVCLYVTGSTQSEIANELGLRSQTDASEIIAHFRELLRAQLPRVLARYPRLNAVGQTMTATSLFKTATHNLGPFMELLNNLKEGTL